MNYIKITSASNPHIKDALDIANKRNKYKHTAFLIEGTHLIETALKSDSEIKRVFFTEAFSSKKNGQKLLKQLFWKFNENNSSSLPVSKMGERGFSGDIFEVTEHILGKLADTETPQGVVAVVSYSPLTLDELPFKKEPLLVVVDAIQDPGNLGTIIRTADAVGADAIILLPGTCDAFMAKTIRSTAGSIFNIPIVYAEADTLLNWLTAKRIRKIVTSADAKTLIFDADLKGAAAFVFGNEAHGASEQLRKSADLILKIPIYGRAESLNVASAAAICLYEAVRQRNLLV